MNDEYGFAAIFERLGRPLQPRDAVPEEELVRAEGLLGHRIPGPVRAFYRLAGRARDFIDKYDHFMPPEELSLDGTRLIFVAENQAVVLYAVDVATADVDPPVLMASNNEPFEWHVVCQRASTFCRVMLHWEGCFGGAMFTTASAAVGEAFRTILAERCEPIGEVNAMWAYGRKHLAACFVAWDDGWRVFLGATSQAALEAASVEFGLRLEP